jgi:hypothetical protein
MVSEGVADHRWGKTKGKVGFHGGKAEVERQRVRTRQGGEIVCRVGKPPSRKTC